MVFAEDQLPPRIKAGAAVKIERRWVANTLPRHELLQAMIYVYSRYRQACSDLAKYLGTTLEPAVPTAESLREWDVHGRRVSYVKFNNKESYSMTTRRVDFDSKFDAPSWLKKVDRTKPRFEIHVEMARNTFLQFGNHLAMIFLFSDEGKIIQQLAFAPSDQVDKFIFWRTLSEKIVYLRAESLIFVAESWVRKDAGLAIPISQAQIIGEMLHVYEINRANKIQFKAWDIIRSGNQVSLADNNDDTFKTSGFPNFLVPVQAAFAQIHKL